MARARNIKPGFFKNEDLAECTPWARLCFAGLWTLADREGRLEDRPKRIKGELFPFDSVEVEPLLAELSQWGFIHRYTVGGGRFVQILKFVEHQAPHGTEKDGLIPDVNGFLTVHERGRNGYATGNSRLEPHASTVVPVEPDGTENSSLTVKGGVSDGGQNTLIPDSLIPDSPIPEVTPQPPKGGSRARDRAVTETPGFIRFWALWPRSKRKEARGECMKLWDKRGYEAIADTIIAHVQARLRTTWTKDNCEFVEAPKVYLNGKPWEGAELLLSSGAVATSTAKPGTDRYFKDHRDAQWWKDAGFANVYEAHNGMCWDHNAHLFRDGRKLTAEEAHA